MTIEDRVKKVISTVLVLNIEEINDKASPTTIISWNSLMHLNLILALEEEFDCEIHDDEAEKITTIQQAVDFIKEKQAT